MLEAAKLRESHMSWTVNSRKIGWMIQAAGKALQVLTAPSWVYLEEIDGRPWKYFWLYFWWHPCFLFFLMEFWMQTQKVMRSAAALNKASVPGCKVTNTHLGPSGAFTEGTRPGPNWAHTGTTPWTPPLVPDSRTTALLSRQLTPSEWISLCFKRVYFLHLMVSYLHAGHYVIPPIQTSKTSEIISRTLLPSSNCSVGILWLLIFSTLQKTSCPIFPFGTTLLLPSSDSMVCLEQRFGDTIVQWTHHLRFEGVITGISSIKTGCGGQWNGLFAFTQLVYTSVLPFHCSHNNRVDPIKHSV